MEFQFQYHYHFLVTESQIERLSDRFTTLDKNQKGYLSREDLLEIPDLTTNPLGDRIIHAFFTDSANTTNDTAVHDNDKLTFYDFVRVMARFQPLKPNSENGKMNSKMEKLKCKLTLI